MIKRCIPETHYHYGILDRDELWFKDGNGTIYSYPAREIAKNHLDDSGQIGRIANFNRFVLCLGGAPFWFCYQDGSTQECRIQEPIITQELKDGMTNLGFKGEFDLCEELLYPTEYKIVKSASF